MLPLLISDNYSSSLRSTPTLLLHTDDEHQQSGDDEHCEDSGQRQAAEYDRAESSIQFRTGTGGHGEREHTEDGRCGGHVDGPQSCSGCFEHCFLVVHSVFSDVAERLVDDEDGVIHNHADEDDESEHCQDIEWLLRDEDVFELQSEESSGSGERDREEDDKRIDEVSEQRGHEQIRDHDGEHEVPLQSVSGNGELVSRTGHTHGKTFEQTHFSDIGHELVLDDLHSFLKRHILGRRDL